MNASTIRMAPTVPSGRLSYNAASRTFSRFASDLTDILGRVPPVEFLVRSARTGRIAGFRLRRVDRDREGDIQAWEYANDSLGLKITLFND